MRYETDVQLVARTEIDFETPPGSRLFVAIAAADACDAYDKPDTNQDGTWWFPEDSAPAEVGASSADAGRSAGFGIARVSGAEDRARVAREDRAAEVRLRGEERVAELEKEANRKEQGHA